MKRFMTLRVPRTRERGAALLAAMLTVTLVATFAAAAMWRQWRSVEIEAAERTRVQSTWVLAGALDWARLILREDGRGATDHLAEPWAVPLEEARLSSFLAAEKNIASDAIEGLPDAFMSGRIIDAQSKLNVSNLVAGGRPVESAVAAFTKLFELLGLPTQEVALLTANLRRASAGLAPAAATGGGGTPTGGGSSATSDTGSGSGTPGSEEGGNTPLMPQQLSQLVWLGLSPQTVAALEPYVILLPASSTSININTASAEVLAASVPGLDLASAKRLVAQRTARFFAELGDAQKLIPESTAQFNSVQHSVGTSYFEVIARLRLDRIWVQEHSLLKRDGTQLTIVWRQRGVGATPPPNKP